MKPVLRRAVFFDRDGTLMEEKHYCKDPLDVRALPGLAAALRRLRERGFLALIITNQSGIGRGLITLEQYHAVQDELLRQLDGQIDAVYFCPETPAGASCRRKPGTGMLEEAQADFSLDLGACWMVGDKDADILCGKNAGMRTVLVRTGYGEQADATLPDFILPNAVSAIQLVLDAN